MSAVSTNTPCVPEEIRQLRSLVRFRAPKVKQQTQVKLRLRALLREHRFRAPEGLRAWTSAYLRQQFLEELSQLREKIREVERRLIQQTVGDAVVSKLLGLEGIGVATAITMRAENARFERFDSGKQLARDCGVTPRNASSGSHGLMVRFASSVARPGSSVHALRTITLCVRQADAGLVKAGNPGLRTVLVQAAQPSARTGKPSPHASRRKANRTTSSWQPWPTAGCGGCIIRCNPSC